MLMFILGIVALVMIIALMVMTSLASDFDSSHE
jgi:glucose uptake protein GlcU